jgi:hypothetical protein
MKATRLRRAAISVAIAVLVGAWASPASSACVPWHASTVLSGQGPVENLVFDGRGGLLLSAIGDNAILRLGENGESEDADRRRLRAGRAAGASRRPLLQHR